jgi:hypothetical protein
MPIFILGMHRSGTSLAARLLNLMGAHLGPESALLPANPDNPSGFWERRDVVGINAALLRHAHAAWHRVEHFSDAKETPEAIEKNMRAVIGEMDARAPWAMKDPRLCLTLPRWLPLLQTPLAVVVSRRPGAIADSLRRRNAMPTEYGLALWEFYAAHLIRHAHGLPKIFVRHEEVLAAPVDAAQKLCASLAGLVPSLRPPDAAAIEAYVAPAPPSPPDLSLTPRQETLAAMLRGEAAWDGKAGVSAAAMEILRRLGPGVSGAPANR